MREIKFRAWDVDLKEMFFMQRGDFHIGGRGANTFTNEWIDRLIGGGFVKEGIHKPKILMQYTSLKDKNLWESDIISDHIGIGVVEYVEKHAAFRVNYQNGRCKWFHDYLDSEMESLERIGNIYENPELLEEK